MRLYCVTYTKRDDEIGEHDTVEYFRTKRDAMRLIRTVLPTEAGPWGPGSQGLDLGSRSFYNISLECVDLYLRKQEIIDALNLSNQGQSALNATLIKHFDDIGVEDER